MPERLEMIGKALSELKSVNGVKACIVASRDGLLIKSIMQKEEVAKSFAAMSATMFGAAETATAQLEKGVPTRVMVETKNESIIAVGAGENALLVALVDTNAGLGMIFLEIENTAKKISQILD